MSKKSVENIFVKRKDILKGDKKKLYIKKSFVYFLMEKKTCLKAIGKDPFDEEGN